MIAATRVRRHVRNKFIASALSTRAGLDDARFSRFLARSISAGGGANRIEQHDAHIGHETWQRPWCARDMEYRLVLEGVATHHIHVDVGTHPLPDLGMS